MPGLDGVRSEVTGERLNNRREAVVGTESSNMQSVGPGVKALAVCLLLYD